MSSFQQHFGDSSGFSPKRMVGAQADLPPNLAERPEFLGAKLSPANKARIQERLGTFRGRVRTVLREHFTERHDPRLDELKSERRTVDLWDKEIRDIAQADDGAIIILSSRGAQKYRLDEDGEFVLEEKDVPASVQAEVFAEKAKAFDTSPADSFPDYFFTGSLPSKSFSPGDINVELGRIGPHALKVLRDGPLSAPDHQLSLVVNGAPTSLYAPEGKIIAGVAARTRKDSRSGTHVHLKVILHEPQPSDGGEHVPQPKQQDVVLYFDREHQLQRVWPETKGQSTFTRLHHESSELDLANLGYLLIGKKQGDTKLRREFDRPILGIRGVIDAGERVYIQVALQGGGHTVLIYHKKTGQLDKTKHEQGEWNAEGVLLDHDRQKVLLLGHSEQTQKAKTLMIEAVREIAVVQDDGYFDAQQKKLIGDALRGFDTDKDDPAGTEQEAVRKFLSGHQVLDDALAHGASVGVIKSLRKLASGTRDAFSEIVREVLEEEAQQKEQHERLERAEGDFRSVSDKLFGNTEVQGALGGKLTRVGTMAGFMEQYHSARKKFFKESNSDMGRVLAERKQGSRNLLTEQDSRFQALRKVLQSTLEGAIVTGKKSVVDHLIALRDAAPEEGFVKLGELKKSARNLEDFCGVLQKLQKSKESYFTCEYIEGEAKLDDGGQAAYDGLCQEFVVASDLHLTTLHSETSGEIVCLQQLLDLCPKVVGEYERKYLDPQAKADFGIRMKTLEGQANAISRKKTMKAVQEDHDRLKREVTDYESGPFASKKLSLDPELRAELQRVKTLIDERAAEAKQRVLIGDSELQEERLRELRSAESDLIAALQDCAQRPLLEHEAQGSAEDISRLRIDELFAFTAGIEVKTGQVDEEQAMLHPKMKRLLSALDESGANPATRRAVWEKVDQAVMRAMNWIHIEKNYYKQPGKYVTGLSPWYQERVEELSGRQSPEVVMDRSQARNTPVALYVSVVRDGDKLVPKLKMIGGGNSSWVLPMASRYNRQLAALEWQSPTDENLKPFYDGPQVSRRDVGFQLLLEQLCTVAHCQDILKRIEFMLADSNGDTGALRAKLGAEIDPVLVRMRADLGISLDAQDRGSITDELCKLLIDSALKFKSPAEEGKPWTLSMMEKTPGDFSKRSQAAEKFLEVYKTSLTSMHREIAKNVGQAREQLGMEFYERPDVVAPYDYRETGMTIVLLEALQSAYEECKEGGKGGVFLFGSPGGGKTTTLEMISLITGYRGLVIPGAELKECTSFDPSQANSPVAKLLLQALVGGVTHFDDLFVVWDEFQLMSLGCQEKAYKLFDNARQILLGDTKRGETDLSVYDTVNVARPTNRFFGTGNTRFTAMINGRYVVIPFEPPAALLRRVVNIQLDRLEESNPYLWVSSYVERVSSDLPIPPDDLTYIISRRLNIGDIDVQLRGAHEGKRDAFVPQSIDAEDPNLKTNFRTHRTQLEKIVRLIDRRCMAAKMVVEAQIAARKTTRCERISDLGMPPCYLETVTASTAKSIMTDLEFNHPDTDEQRAREIIAEKMLDDSPEAKAHENRLWVAKITGVGYNPSAWAEACDTALRIKREGEVQDPVAKKISGLTEAVKDLAAVKDLILDPSTDPNKKAKALAISVQFGQHLIEQIARLQGALPNQAPPVSTNAVSAPSNGVTVSNGTLEDLTRTLQGLLAIFQDVERRRAEAAAKGSAAKTKSQPLSAI